MSAMDHRPGLIRRLLAASTGALVLFLTVLAASPDLHARLHGDAGGHDDSGCVVALFGQGVSLAAGADALVVVPVEWQIAAPLPTEEILLAATRYLRQPERGPPALG